MSSLKQIFENLNGEHWHENHGWKGNTDVCEWYGVSCNEYNEVIGLSLDSNNLRGKLPEDPNVYSSLSSLESLMLGWNNIQGNIPSGVCSLSSATSMSFAHNNFDGLDSCMRDLYQLKLLHLSHNNFSEDVISKLPPQIEILEIQENYLTSIDLSRFNQLTSLDISVNKIHGNASFLNNIPDSLRTLRVDRNSISGTLDSLNWTRFGSKAQRLSILSMAANSLSGVLPSDTISKLSNLRYLDLSENDFEGPIPSDLVKLTSLSELYLRSNLFTSVTELPGARIVDLSENPFECPLPQGAQYQTATCRCPIGYSGNRNASCSICQEGSIQTLDGEGSAICEDCPANTFANAQGATACKPCGFLMISGRGWTKCSSVVLVIMLITIVSVLSGLIFGLVFYFKKREKTLLDQIKLRGGKAPLLRRQDGTPAPDPDNEEEM